MKPFSTPYTWYTNKFRGKGEKAAYIEYSITLTAGLGSLLFGYDQGVFGGLLTGAPFTAQFPQIQSTVNPTLQGFTTAVYELGCAAGALIVLTAGDKLGRRMTIIVGMVILAIGAVLQFLSWSLAQLIVGRIITGLGNGMTTAVLPVWNGECSRDHNRGRAILWELNINILGIAIAYWIDYGLSESSRTGNTQWQFRFPLSLQVFFAGLVIVLTLFLPESPRYLIKKNRLEEARNVIDMLSPIEDEVHRKDVVDERMRMIENALNEELRSSADSWLDCFKQGKERFLQRTLLAIMAMCMLQLSGINLITYYLPVVLEETVGMSRNLALLVTGINGICYWLCTFIPLPLIDRVGRRPLMLFAAVGQSVTMALLAATLSDPSNKAMGYAATVFLFVFNFFFSVGFCGIPFLYPMELTPLQTRNKSVAIATACFWICNFFVVMISPVLIDNTGYKTYLVWMCTNLVFIPMIYYLLPETANAALEDIDVLFETSTTWFIGPESKRRLSDIVRTRVSMQHAALAGNGADRGEDDREKKEVRIEGKVA